MQIEVLGWAALLLACRLLPLIWFIPAQRFGAVRLYILCSFTIGLAPALLGPAGALLLPLQRAGDPGHWAILGALSPLIARELLVGFALGLAVSVPFAAATSAGSLVDGLGELEPQTGEGPGGVGTGPVGTLYKWVAVSLFVGISGPQLLLGGLARSYEVIPLGKAVPGGLLTLAIDVSARIFTAALMIAAPPLLALLLSRLLLAFAFRTQSLSRTSVAAGLSAPVHGLLLLVVLLLSSASVLAILREEEGHLPKLILAMLRRLAA